MSVREVRAEIRRSMRTLGACDSSHVDSSEAKKIGKVALKGGVTASEAKVLEDLIDKGTPRSPGMMMTLACPEHPRDHYTIDPAAVGEINALFARNLLPYGDNKGSLRQQIKETLDDLELGEPLATPPRTGRLHPMLIDDLRPVDGNRRDAFINPAKKEFYLKVTGAGMAGPHTVGPYWHGPFSISARPAIRQETLDSMRAAYFREARAGHLNWTNSLPLGSRFETVELMRERHPDGYAYSACIPIGALTPTAPRTDPNDATQFFIKRTGGFAGLTQYAGPIQIND